MKYKSDRKLAKYSKLNWDRNIFRLSMSVKVFTLYFEAAPLKSESSLSEHSERSSSLTLDRESILEYSLSHANCIAHTHC